VTIIGCCTCKFTLFDMEVREMGVNGVMGDDKYQLFRSAMKSNFLPSPIRFVIDFLPNIHTASRWH